MAAKPILARTLKNSPFLPLFLTIPRVLRSPADKKPATLRLSHAVWRASAGTEDCQTVEIISPRVAEVVLDSVTLGSTRKNA